MPVSPGTRLGVDAKPGPSSGPAFWAKCGVPTSLTWAAEDPS